MAVDVQYALSGFNKKEYHHFYPRAYLKAIGYGDASNVLGNIVMITSNTNKIISDNPPEKYIPDIVKSLGSESDAVFKSNLLPLPSEFNYSRASYEDFLQARGKILTAYVSNTLLTS